MKKKEHLYDIKEIHLKNKTMTQQNESAKSLELETGKDYINVHDNNIIIIDKTENIINRGFEGGEYKIYMGYLYTSEWREATEQEVIAVFEKHLVKRYGEDWRIMKIKEVHPSLSSSTVINDDDYDAVIAKLADGWNAWNVNGLLYRNGIWVERLEEEPKIHITEAMNKKEKEIMQKYKLKQWYPNLHLAWSTTDNYEYDREDNRMYNRTRWGTISITAPYLHPDFWELIEEQKPLFITDDGVKVFSDIDNLFAVNLTYFSKTQNTLRSSGWLIDNPSYKVFLNEASADEYIWRNKPLFSYEDFIRWGNVPYERVIMQLAKERVEQ